MIFSNAHAASIFVEVCIALIFRFILPDTFFSTEELSPHDAGLVGMRYANLPLPSRKPFVMVQRIYRPATLLDVTPQSRSLSQLP